MKQYNEHIIRVRRNTGPVGGPYVCEAGRWQEDTLRGKRDRFIVARTIKVGTRQECELAEAEARKVADIKKGTDMTTTNKTDGTLVYAETGKLVQPGDVVQVRNVSMKVIAIRPPRHEGSSGKVLVQCDGSNADEQSEYEYYPSVIGAAWVTNPKVVERAKASTAKKTPKCDICEENAAEVQVSVTDMDGVVLDTGTYCRECVRGELGVIGLVIGEVR